MKVGDFVTDGGDKILKLVSLSHPTNLGGSYYGVEDQADGRVFYVKSYYLKKVERLPAAPKPGGPNSVTVAQRLHLANLGESKAVEELHPELHAEFRAAWPTMSEEGAKGWVERLKALPQAKTDSFGLLGLREVREMGLDDSFAGMQRRKAAVLATIPVEDRPAVYSSALLMQNMVGGRISDCLHSAAQSFRRLGREEMQKRDRLTCAHAMGWAVDEDGHRIDRPA